MFRPRWWVFCLVVGSAWGAADGPANQEEAERWLEQVFLLVEQAAGRPLDPPLPKTPETPEKPSRKRWPRIVLAAPAEAGSALAAEFGEFLPALGALVPPPEELGKEFLARYCFGPRAILVVPENLRRVQGGQALTGAERQALLKVVLAHACALAWLDAQAPFAPAYYALGGSDAGLAHRAVWEGFARQMQEDVARAVGCGGPLLAAALLNTFAVLPEPDPKENPREQQARLMRVTSAGRLCEVGADFARALRNAKGAEGILEALRRPPYRTAQVIVPADYLEGRGYTPSDEDLGNALARAAGGWFPPETWANDSSALGALSREGILSSALWKAGAGPVQEQKESFDLEYIGGRSLTGVKRDGAGHRAAGLHVFRHAAAAGRFMAQRGARIKEDWKRLARDRFGFEDGVEVDLPTLGLPRDSAGTLDEALVLVTNIIRPDASRYTEAHVYFRKGGWVLELDLDVKPPLADLGSAATELITSAGAEATPPRSK